MAGGPRRGRGRRTARGRPRDASPARLPGCPSRRGTAERMRAAAEEPVEQLSRSSSSRRSFSTARLVLLLLARRAPADDRGAQAPARTRLREARAPGAGERPAAWAISLPPTHDRASSQPCGVERPAGDHRDRVDAGPGALPVTFRTASRACVSNGIVRPSCCTGSSAQLLDRRDVGHLRRARGAAGEERQRERGRRARATRRQPRRARRAAAGTGRGAWRRRRSCRRRAGRSRRRPPAVRVARDGEDRRLPALLHAGSCSGRNDSRRRRAAC